MPTPLALMTVQLVALLALLAAQVLAVGDNTILSANRAQAAAASWGDLFIVAGGLTPLGGLVKPIEMISVSSAGGRCSFSRVGMLNIKTPRSQLGGASAAGLIMFAGGKYVSPPRQVS